MSRSVVYGLFGLLAVGCTSLRSNARLQPGGSGGVVLAGAYFPADRDASHPDGRETSTGGPAPEAFLQLAQTDESGSGTAFQLKVPLAFIAATADIYHQFGGSDRWSHGGGVELGLLNGGAYYLLTRHLGTLYATASGRLVAQWEGLQPVLTAQLAFGRERHVDLFGFATYNRALGDGIEFGFEGSYPLRSWLLGGFGLRFF